MVVEKGGTSPKPGVATGGADPFDSFLRERRPSLLRFLRGLKVAEEDAQDYAQESLTRLVRYKHREPTTAWPALLYRIALNVVRDASRRAQSRGKQELGDAASIVESVVSDDPSPEQYASQQQALGQLRAAILQLPPRCREVYLLHRMDGLSYPEIASHAGISVKGVEKHIGRALRELRVTFTAEFDPLRQEGNHDGPNTSR